MFSKPSKMFYIILKLVYFTGDILILWKYIITNSLFYNFSLFGVSAKWVLSVCLKSG